MLQISLIAVGLVLVVCVFFTIKGPSIWDRLLWANLISTLLIVAMLILSISDTGVNPDYFLDAAIAVCLLGFIGTNFIAVFLRRKGGGGL